MRSDIVVWLRYVRVSLSIAERRDLWCGWAGKCSMWHFSCVSSG